MPWKQIPVSSDAPVFSGPVIYGGGVLRSTAAGVGEVIVRDGVSASAQLIDYFRAAASDRDRNELSRGIFAMRGLFVDLVVNVSEFVLYYDDDIPAALAGPEVGQAV